jgi:hypothetical protein
MAKSGEAWTTDLKESNATRACFGLSPEADGLAGWEGADLLLVTAPAWFDLEIRFPPNVVHAGSLGVHASPRPSRCRPLIAFSFSTTEMAGKRR